MAFLPGWDAWVTESLSNWQSVWRRETFCKFPGFMLGKNRENCPLNLSSFSAAALVPC